MDWIDKIVIGILDIYGTNNPYEILASMEVEIVKANRKNPILMKKNCIYIADFNAIYIRDDLNSNHELFYLRHELGHILLHLDINNLMIKNNWKIEKEANYFAFKLSKITFDEVSLFQMSSDQIASCLEIPEQILRQLVNI